MPTPISITGIDEAGRGALAGPVVAAAVVFDSGLGVHPLIRDSKKLTSAQREQMFDWIQQHALAIGVGMASAGTVDRINVLQATMLAMSRAVLRLPEPWGDGALFIDGNRVPKVLQHRATAVVHGDRLIPAISAASIIAKVTRDRIMCALGAKFPVYGFAIHKGYGTQLHRDAIRDFGPCPSHRRTFAPMALPKNAPSGVSTRSFDSAQGPYAVPERSRRTGSKSLLDTFFDSAI